MNKEILCKCLLECKDEILVFTNFTSLVLISTMIALLVILFIIKLYAQNNTSKIYNICCVPAQIPYLGKFLPLTYGLKCSQPIRLQDFLINHISRTNK